MGIASVGRHFRWGLVLVPICLVASTGRISSQGRATTSQASVRPGPDILYAAPAVSPQLANAGVWRAAPILVSGTTAYRSGEFLYQDYLYDDRGAAQRALYPSGRPEYASNAADFVEVRLKPLATETAIRITFNTMIDPALVGTVIALGDGVPNAALPFGAGGRMPASVFVTVHGATGTITDASTGAKLAVPAVVTVNLNARQLDVRVPYGAFDPRGKTSVRIAAGAGLWDPQKGGFRTPESPAAPPPPEPGAAAPARGRGRGTLPPLNPERSLLFNMAFRTRESPNTNSVLAFFNDVRQGEVLDSGNLSPLFANVDFVKLASGTDDNSQVPTTGPMSRILVSHFEPAQGRGAATNLSKTCAAPCIPEFAGRLQPYGIYVPNKTPPAAGYGLTIDLHSASANYGRWLGQSRYPQFGERGTGSIVVTPNGRGLGSGYWAEAAADVFEVWADVARRYKIDPEYVSLAGVSMGANGSFKFAALFPDLFAAMAVSVGCPNFMLEAHRYVATFIHTGDIDATTNCHPGHQFMDRYALSGQQHVWWNFLEHPHAFSSRPRDWQPFADYLGMRKRVVDPPHVTYYLNADMNETKFGVNADHAYWVSGLVLRDANYKGGPNAALDAVARAAATAYGRIDVMSHGMGRGDPSPKPVMKTKGVYNFGVDYPWPNYNSEEVVWGPAPATTVRNVLEISAENIATVTIDAKRAKVDCGATINVKSDGPIAVKLTGCTSVKVINR